VVPRPPRGESTNAVAAGDLSVRTASARRDELGDLGRSFDGMTTAVAKRPRGVYTGSVLLALDKLHAAMETLERRLG
jgi:methyl-accepting chemotaxis protein